MKTPETNTVAGYGARHSWPMSGKAGLHPSHLYLVTKHDLRNIRDELARGNVPADLEAKLAGLAASNLGHRFIEQNCRTIIALLQAAEQGAFREVSPAEIEKLERVLAYVRKDDDAIPDYGPSGFLDDQHEIRAITTELNLLLQAFKAWRLSHQVPGMWLAERPGSSSWKAD